MTAQFTCEEILEICEGRLTAGMMPDEAGAICTDTRKVKEGDWYLALSGEKFDGHDFLGDAFASGAMGAIVAARSHYSISSPNFPLIAVGDTLMAYHMLARNWRKRISPRVVAITGSSGKTTTKEMGAAVFGHARRCHYSARNENNEYGVPGTLLAMPDDTQVAVIEMAMRGLKQIELLAKCAVPDIGIITNAGTAHIELLGSVDNIAQAKCELLEHLKPGRGVAIIGGPSELLLKRAKQVFSGKMHIFNDNSIEVLNSTADGTTFKTPENNTEFFICVNGLPLLQDAWCIIMAGRELGLDDDLIRDGLRRFRPPGGRGNKLVTTSGALVLDESYNGNPDSVRAAVTGMIESATQPKKVVVLGDLAELGDHTQPLLHELGTWLKDKPLTTLITVGALARHIAQGASGADYEVLVCDSIPASEEHLRTRLDASSCVLIKGSRSAKLDKLVSLLTGKN
jgi:UDP-N-acetylmuramoyl-tripeptide--D-alanyl-D-alanine ligase